MVDRGLPIVQVGWSNDEGSNDPRVLRAPRVASDIERAGALLVDHFAGRGITQLVCFCTGIRRSRNSRRRAAAFLRRGRVLGCRVHSFVVGPRTRGKSKWTLDDQFADLGDLVRSLPKNRSG